MEVTTTSEGATTLATDAAKGNIDTRTEAVDQAQSLDLSKLKVIGGSGDTIVSASTIEKNTFEIEGHKFLLVHSGANFDNFDKAAKDVTLIKLQNNTADAVYAGNDADDKVIASELTRVTGLKFTVPADGEPNAGALINMSDTKLQKSGKSLTLQIGDTAEAYNKLSVTVGDMHVKSLGLSDVDISTQDGAAKSLDKIKDAINQVSDTRGSLGALSNRLDHTINNLGVMRENIQNAESNIRDTDVAEEMMNYTKNSILNQSAQAMLAQANQLPQGVLQLLQG
ncbi:MAG: hypothetical protein IJ829_05240 [Kiritimatiellae bacterium]|nr:hypothetical protein [Kiritimatiellia bacterium]